MKNEVHEALDAFGRARARQATPKWAVRGFTAGVAVVALALALQQALLWRLVLSGPVLPDRFWLIWLPALPALAAGLVVALHRPPVERVAREADARLELEERVSTALELERRLGPDRRQDASGARAGASALLASLQRADALARLRRHDPTDVFPTRLARREVLALAFGLTLLVGLATLPEPTGADSRRSLATEAVQSEAERLSALAEELAGANDPTGENQVLAQALAQVADQLSQQASSPEKALSSLSQAERSLAKQQDANAADSELALARLADALNQTDAGRELAQRLDRRDYAGASQEMQRLGREAAQLAPDQQRALSDALQKGAASASRLDSTLAQRLQDAAKSLGGDQSEQAAAQAGQEIQRAGNQAQRERALERALSELQDSRQAIGQAERGQSQGRSQGQGQGQQAAGTSSGQSQQAGAADGQGQDGQSGEGQGSGQGAGQSGSGAQGNDGGNGGQGQSGGSSWGTGSIQARGESDPLDSRSRQVTVPSDEFERPQVSQGQQAGEGPVGEATVDYRQVLPQYAERATEAMAQRYVPPAMKDLVRDYFSSLGTGR